MVGSAEAGFFVFVLHSSKPWDSGRGELNRGHSSGEQWFLTPPPSISSNLKCTHIALSHPHLCPAKSNSGNQDDF